MHLNIGDDCISIESGTQKLKITDIICGPGHGIRYIESVLFFYQFCFKSLCAQLFYYLIHFCKFSIGSLGDGNSEAHVSDVVVDGAKISGTSNGVRIKTYQVKNTLRKLKSECYGNLSA